MDKGQVEFLELQRSLMVQASRRADEAAREWRTRAADIEASAHAAGWDDEKLRSYRDSDITLRQADQAYSFHSGEAQRRAAVITAYVLSTDAIEEFKHEQWERRQGRVSGEGGSGPGPENGAVGEQSRGERTHNGGGGTGQS